MKINNKDIETLKLYVPIVSKVHGKAHPEFLKVKDEFDLLLNKINNDNFDISNELNNLRTITNNYQIPIDVCESYETVYKLLSKIDESYKENLNAKNNI